MKTYNVVSGAVFGFIALAQATRAAMQLPVQVGDFTVPVLASWIAALVAASLCVWAFRSRN